MSDAMEFDAVLLQSDGMDAAYVEVPFDIRARYGVGRLAVHAAFDGVPYDGQVVRMGTPGWIIGVRKDIRRRLGKTFGDSVHVELCPRCAARLPAAGTGGDSGTTGAVRSEKNP